MSNNIEFSALDRELGAMLARRSKQPNDEKLEKIGMMLSRAWRSGSTILRLNEIKEENITADELRDLCAKDWEKVVTFEPNKKTIPNTPLVFDYGSLYFQRQWRYEVEIAERLANLTKNSDSGATLSPKELELLCYDFDDKIRNEEGLPRFRAIAAAKRGFLAITGGPGTGKTTIAQRLILAEFMSNPNARVLCAAFTARAAKRLGEALQENLGKFDKERGDATEKLRNIEPKTLHKLLGYHDGNFRNNAENPLDATLVVIDEFSMVSADFTLALLRALPQTCRLIILGDAQQLPSIDAGCVLADIEYAAMPRFLSTKEELKNLPKAFGETFPDNEPTGKPTISNSVIRLRVNFRAQNARGIIDAAQAVLRNSADVVQELHEVAKKSSSNFKLMDYTPDNREKLLEYVCGKYRAFVDKAKGWQPDTDQIKLPNTEKLFNEFNNFRLMVPENSGDDGIENLNESIMKELKLAEYSVGVPYAVGRNDYNKGLFNGDVAICVIKDEKIVAVLPDGRIFPPEELPDAAPCFAMTVHKAQGSGFDKVAMILPPYETELSNRSIVYTAITRAKSTFHMLAIDESLQKAIANDGKRASNLAKRLRVARKFRRYRGLRCRRNILACSRQTRHRQSWRRYRTRRSISRCR